MAASGVGGHIESAVGIPTGDACADLKAAWIKHGQRSANAWHRSYNAWAAHLGCAKLNPKAGTGQLSSTDLADISAFGYQRSNPPVSIPKAPLPKGGPPTDDRSIQGFTPLPTTPDDRTTRLPPLPPSPGAAGDEDKPWWKTAYNLLAGFIDAGCGLSEWVKAPQLTMGDALRAAMNDEGGVRAVGRIRTPFPLPGSDDFARMCYSKGRGMGWFIKTHRSFLPDWGCRDVEVSPLAISEVGTNEVDEGANNPAYWGSGGGQLPTTPSPPGMPGGGGVGIVELLGAGTAPKITQRRTCPPMGGVKMRLATNGMCYPKALLPRAFWMSTEARNVFTARDRKTLSRAKTVQDKLTKLEQDYGKPKHHRRRSTHHHHHHHE